MNKLVNNILCPTDFSDAAINATEFAARLARQLNSKLTLWNMFELEVLEAAQSTSHIPHSIDQKQAELATVLDEWCEEISAEFNVQCGYALQPQINSLEKTLAHYLEGSRYDLVVAGTNGADSLYQYYFGSNSYRLIRNVRHPVLVVPEGTGTLPVKSILFTSDNHPSDIQALEKLLELFDAPIDVVHISQKALGVNGHATRAFRNLAEDHFENDARLRYQTVQSKDVLSGVLDQINEWQPDLLVLSTQHRRFLSQLMHKSFTRQLLATSPVPVLAFPA